MNILKPILKQIFPDKPPHTRITITTPARELMGAYAIQEDIIKDVIRYGKQSSKYEHVKFKFYNGYGISVTAKYNSMQKIWIVLSVRKWNKQ